MNLDDEKLRKYFSEYYESVSPVPPDLLSSREIGFIPFGGTMIRHRRLMNRDELQQFLRSNVPRHFYYSTAYYRYPETKKMSDKEWLGAELIFDLDADHLPGADKLTYEQILNEVKKHTHRLIFNFLMQDLGFSEDELMISFSGGRGYHVHVLSEKVYPLDSDARREIANYVRGEGLDQRNFLFEMRKQNDTGKGWFRIIDSAFSGLCRNILSEEKDSLEYLAACLGNRNSSRAFVNALKSGVKVERRIEKKENLFLRPGRSKYGVMDERDEKVLLCVTKSVVGKESAEIDEPVTTDVHRLIRFPYSLHGKTGLMVKPISLDEFRHFDPLKDAIPENFKETTEKIVMREDAEITFADQKFSLQRGVNEVPLFVAIFFVAQRVATFNLE